MPTPRRPGVARSDLTPFRLRLSFSTPSPYEIEIVKHRTNPHIKHSRFYHSSHWRRRGKKKKKKKHRLCPGDLSQLNPICWKLVTSNRTFSFVLFFFFFFFLMIVRHIGRKAIFVFRKRYARFPVSPYLDSPLEHAFNGTGNGSILRIRYFSNLSRCTPSDTR